MNKKYIELNINKDTNSKLIYKLSNYVPDPVYKASSQYYIGIGYINECLKHNSGGIKNNG